MSEWWTYTLSDFLMFAPRTYYRMIELYNVAIWPAQLVAAAVGVAVAVLLAGRRGGRDRIICGLLAGCWLWIAWSFHYQRYAQINWAASWFAAAFALEALLLAGVGVIAGRIALRPAGSVRCTVAVVLVVMTVFCYPLLAALTGRSWTTSETFGVTPDPTAIATIAALALAGGRIRLLLLIVPVLWCAVAAATLWAMDSRTDAVVVAGVAVLALWPAIRGTPATGRLVAR
jgi:hypothetical protein